MSDARITPRIQPLPRRDGEPWLNIFGTLARNDDLLKAFQRFGGYLLGGGLLPAREREIVILRTGWRCHSEYEFGQHTVIGKAAGLTDREVACLAGADPGEWSPGDAALVAMVDELCADNLVGEQTWAALSERWNDAELLELLMLAGFYRLVSGLLNSAGVPLEATTPGWPTGAQPRRHAPRDAAADPA